MTVVGAGSELSYDGPCSSPCILCDTEWWGVLPVLSCTALHYRDARLSWTQTCTTRVAHGNSLIMQDSR